MTVYYYLPINSYEKALDHWCVYGFKNNAGVYNSRYLVIYKQNPENPDSDISASFSTRKSLPPRNRVPAVTYKKDGTIILHRTDWRYSKADRELLSSMVGVNLKLFNGSIKYLKDKSHLAPYVMWDHKSSCLVIKDGKVLEQKIEALFNFYI